METSFFEIISNFLEDLDHSDAQKIVKDRVEALRKKMHGLDSDEDIASSYYDW